MCMQRRKNSSFLQLMQPECLCLSSKRRATLLQNYRKSICLIKETVIAYTTLICVL